MESPRISGARIARCRRAHTSADLANADEPAIRPKRIFATYGPNGSKGKVSMQTWAFKTWACRPRLGMQT